MTWGTIMAAHLTAFLGVGLADLLPRPEQSRAIFSLLVLALVPPHVAVLGLVAIRPSMMNWPPENVRHEAVQAAAWSCRA